MKFREKKIWKDAVDISIDIHKLFSQKDSNYFSLFNHIKKTSISVPSNIAEGFERDSDKELAYFLRVSKGSLGELYTQIFIAKELNTIQTDDFDELSDNITDIENQLGGFIQYLKHSEKE